MTASDSDSQGSALIDIGTASFEQIVRASVVRQFLGLSKSTSNKSVENG
jgi:hypothetical protein